MNSIFKKMAVRISLLYLIVIIISGTVSFVHLDRKYKDNIEQDLLQEAKVIDRIVAASHKLDDVVYSFDKIMDMRVTIVDFEGNVLLDTRADVSQLDNHITRPEIQEALKTGSGVNIRHSDTLKQDLMYAAVYTGDTYIIRTSLSLEGISEYSAGLWIPLIIVLLISFLLLLVIALSVSRSITNPIIKIKNDTVRISNGQYDYVERLKTGDEIEELSDALNDMVSVLKQNIEGVSERNSRLQAVFRAVPGGILAVDNDDNVIMANPAAKEMFSITGSPEGKHFLEVAKHAKLENVIKDAKNAKGVVQKEITIARGMEEIYLQVFAVSAADHGVEYGVILLAQDITRIRKLENIRSDFAANVSHELKTPLTVISGFIDTLKDETIGRDDAVRFLDIISLESERLTRLIDDVLALSEIENTPAAPNSVVDIRQGTVEAIQLLERKAKKKNVEVTANIPDDEVLIFAENDRIKQMVINLVDNAIKYTPEGGKVTVKINKEDTMALLTVKDTGIGIPEDNIPRLFERFYRVDKSRSRALGGTGLGLAIVKHVVNLLNGHITVKSKVGKGTVFHIYLPLSS